VHEPARRVHALRDVGTQRMTVLLVVYPFFILGRITNRFSRDLVNLDSNLPTHLGITMSGCMFLIHLVFLFFVIFLNLLTIFC
jgi:hypothetical protein